MEFVCSMKTKTCQNTISFPNDTFVYFVPIESKSDNMPPPNVIYLYADNLYIY
jgi:hypothetical protein